MADYTDQLNQMMKQAGLTPGGRGQGFADVPYWNDVANRAGFGYVQGRLGADLAGKGTDRSEGTPQSGIWDQSGSGGGGGQAPAVQSQQAYGNPLMGALQALGSMGSSPLNAGMWNTGGGGLPQALQGGGQQGILQLLQQIFKNGQQNTVQPQQGHGQPMQNDPSMQQTM